MRGYPHVGDVRREKKKQYIDYIAWYEQNCDILLYKFTEEKEKKDERKMKKYEEQISKRIYLRGILLYFTKKCILKPFKRNRTDLVRT